MNVIVALGASAAAGAIGGTAAWFLFGPSYGAIGAGAAAGVASAVLFGRIYRTKP